MTRQWSSAAEKNISELHGFNILSTFKNTFSPIHPSHDFSFEGSIISGISNVQFFIRVHSIPLRRGRNVGYENPISQSFIALQQLLNLNNTIIFGML
tara:strand:+ start:145 stop:435 length:291 start_codon:yes stop_codon:yes gene_type:complete